MKKVWEWQDWILLGMPAMENMRKMPKMWRHMSLFRGYWGLVRVWNRWETIWSVLIWSGRHLPANIPHLPCIGLLRMKSSRSPWRWWKKVCVFMTTRLGYLPTIRLLTSRCFCWTIICNYHQNSLKIIWHPAFLAPTAEEWEHSVCREIYRRHPVLSEQHLQS